MKMKIKKKEGKGKGIIEMKVRGCYLLCGRGVE